MELETLNDVITWNRELHLHLGRCLHQQMPLQKDEHAQMLMGYLAEQEEKIAEIIEEFHQQAEPAVLNTWCVEYLEKKHFNDHSHCETPYASMSADDITAQVSKQHEEVIELLQYLQGRVDGEARTSLIDNLLQLEKQETMRITQSANRWSDL